MFTPRKHDALDKFLGSVLNALAGIGLFAFTITLAFVIGYLK